MKSKILAELGPPPGTGATRLDLAAKTVFLFPLPRPCRFLPLSRKHKLLSDKCLTYQLIYESRQIRAELRSVIVTRCEQIR